MSNFVIDEGVAFIEVKNPTIAVDLEIQGRAVAQALREAHILLTSSSQDSIPFILTNGYGWSFGLANLKGTKIDFEGSTHPPDQLKSGQHPIYSNQRVRLVLWTSKPDQD